MLDKLLEIVYPTKCGICNKLNKNGLCGLCYKKLVRNNKASKIVPSIKLGEVYFDDGIFLFEYKKVRNLILKFKFGNKAYLKRLFATIIKKDSYVMDFIKKYDLIIPVPIHKNRYRERGYNQTELIVREIGLEREKLEENNLVKLINTKPQSSLDLEDRKNNLANAYYLLKPERIKNKRVLLIDDVYTTGNTVNECSKILKKR